MSRQSRSLPTSAARMAQPSRFSKGLLFLSLLKIAFCVFVLFYLADVEHHETSRSDMNHGKSRHGEPDPYENVQSHMQPKESTRGVSRIAYVEIALAVFQCVAAFHTASLTFWIMQAVYGTVTTSFTLICISFVLQTPDLLLYEVWALWIWVVSDVWLMVFIHNMETH